MTASDTIAHDTAAILSAFWHRGRHKYVEWMGHEIIARSGATSRHIIIADRAGMIARTGSHYNRTPIEQRSYRITDAGLMFLRHIGKEKADA